MEIVLLEVGKTSKPYLAEGVEEYKKRLRRYIPFREEIINVPKKWNKLEPAKLKLKEGELIANKIKPDDCVVLLDENGEKMNSRKFAGFIQKRMNSGVRRLVIVIGGAYGFSPDIKSQADFKLSLSAMTFSHQLIRLIFAEQLYRAFSIIRNEPYHND